MQLLKSDKAVNHKQQHGDDDKEIHPSTPASFQPNDSWANKTAQSWPLGGATNSTSCRTSRYK